LPALAFAASFFAAAIFRISLCEMRRQEICLITFILFGSITIRVITLYTIILPELYLYDNYMTSGKTISENIKRLRNKLGLTQDDLAKKADIKYTTLMKVESGTVNKPSVQTMAKIAKALGVSIEDLIK